MNKEKLRNQNDWAGVFQTMALKVCLCTSEEQLYRQLREFKNEFNSEYGKLSRAKRLANGFREKEE